MPSRKLEPKGSSGYDWMSDTGVGKWRQFCPGDKLHLNAGLRISRSIVFKRWQAVNIKGIHMKILEICLLNYSI